MSVRRTVLLSGDQAGEGGSQESEWVWLEAESFPTQPSAVSGNPSALNNLCCFCSATQDYSFEFGSHHLEEKYHVSLLFSVK